MVTCGHASKLKVSGSWILLQQRLQQTNEKTARNNPLRFDFCPTINFQLKTDVREDSADFYVCCDGGIRDDFDCILWVENEREATEHTMAINQHVKTQHSGQSLAIHFKIVHNVYSVLIINFSEDHKFQSQRRRKLESLDEHSDSKKLNEELEEQKSEILKLNVQVETLTGELVVVKFKCDQLNERISTLKAERDKLTAEPSGHYKEQSNVVPSF